MLRFALLGAGFIGSVHAKNLARHPDVDLAVVVDVDATRADQLAQRYGAAATTEEAVAFDPGRVDAVLVASSTDSHAHHLRRAADSGLAVLCEKPIDLDLASAVEVGRHVSSTGVPVMVDFNRRFDRAYAELHRAVSEGEVGDVELVQLTSRGPTMPPLSYIASSGGQMRDQAVHFFDLARWITGQDPVEVFAAGSALADPRVAEYGDVDTSVTTLRLPSGALVQVDCARRTGYGYDEKIEVHGSTGMIEARRQRSGAVTRYTGTRVVEDGLHAGWFERLQPTYAAALDHFVRSVNTSVAPAPSLKDGLRAQAIAEAATTSLTSRASVPITYDLF
ncbi:MAG: Gfo/Idh/MocA family oxidoreductase [Friedmanniella sp.]